MFIVSSSYTASLNLPALIIPYACGLLPAVLLWPASPHVEHLYGTGLSYLPYPLLEVLGLRDIVDDPSMRFLRGRPRGIRISGVVCSRYPPPNQQYR